MSHYWRYALVLPLAAWLTGDPVRVPAARPLPPASAEAACPAYAAARARLFLAYGFRLDRPLWANRLAAHAFQITRACPGPSAHELRSALTEALPAVGSAPHPPL